MKRKLLLKLVACVLGATVQVAMFTAQAEDVPDMVAPYATTPESVVEQMLLLARVGPDDFVVDLGSGDGRVVIAAVKKFNARGGFGVDIDSSLVDYANAKAQAEGVADRAKFHLRDLFKTDIREASVVTVYLLPRGMNKLRSKLLAELNPGTRVVAHDYQFQGWPVDRIMSFDVPEKNDYTGRRNTALYLYIVPAPIVPAVPHRPAAVAPGERGSAAD
ncbi:MAG: class I SAM-dependent methyltransferase [Betaproteobacteria bacterium]|nr:class I SAM-dependent methyltransferase [Betaproteobacteria bacterium]